MAVTTSQVWRSGEAGAQPLPPDAGSRRSRRLASAGVALSAVAVLFLLFDSAGKLLKVEPVVAGTAELGYPGTIVRTLGVLLLLCVVVYLIPRVSVVGAVLLTGYLGGAVATHVRVGSPLLTHVLFPVYLGVMIWGGLVLRDERLRRLLRARERA